MTEIPIGPVTLPTERPAGCPFDPPTGLAALRERAPLTRMKFPDGHLGWLATDHATVRAVLADTRFSSRMELQHYALRDAGPLQEAPPGGISAMDAPEHTRFRKLLAGKFTARRMRLLTERIEQLVTEHLDEMERAGGPLDLVEAFAFPVPALLTCELLGVPYDDRPRFQDLASAIVKPHASIAEMWASFAALQKYIMELVHAKQIEPTDDVLGELTATSDLTDDELAGVGAFLLGSGLHTTASMLALGTFALLSNPDQLTLLRTEPELADNAAEELMRYLSITHTGTRAALVDIELAGQIVSAGETVAISIQAANRDPAKFDNPNKLDLRRNTMGHLGFGHGPHQCLGAQLARVEMRVALPALLSRFPKLHLAVPAEEIPLRHGVDIYGVYELPVTW